VDRDRDLRQRIAAIPGLGTIAGQSLYGTDGAKLLPLVAAGLDAIELSDLPKATKRELTSTFVDNLVHDAARRPALLPTWLTQWWLASRVLFKIVYLLTRKVLGLAVLLFREDRAKDAERHQRKDGGVADA